MIKIFDHEIVYKPINISNIIPDSFKWNDWSLLRNIRGNYYYWSFENDYWTIVINRKIAYKQIFMQLYLIRL